MLDLVQHLDNAIQRGDQHQSKLTGDALAIGGMTGYKIRHTLNNVVDNSEVNYLEIGVWRGATFISALYGNHPNSAIAVDNWSKFNKTNPQAAFYTNVSRLLMPMSYSYRIFEIDSFSIPLVDIVNPINVYFYDGDHTEASQYNALAYYYPVLAKQFIYMVDDWQRPEVRLGTKNAMMALNLSIDYEREFTGRDDAYGWWNGFYACTLSKKTNE